MEVRPISVFLRSLGLTGAAEQDMARRVLEEAGLTRLGRRNMARAKEPGARQALGRALALHCGRDPCRTALLARGDGRMPVRASRSACEACHGSVNRAELLEMGQALRARGLARVLVVGGSATLHAELRSLGPPGIAWRFVEGARRVDAKKAGRDLAWADVAVVWASGHLPHRVSDHYTSAAAAVTVPRRGIAALARAVREHVARRAADALTSPSLGS